MSGEPEPDDIEFQAGQWILRRDLGEFSPDDRAAHETWLMADARHRAAYLRLDQAWRKSAGLKIWRPADGTVDPDVLASQRAARPSTAPRRWPLALAAALLLAILAGGAWYLVGILHVQTYTTEVGGYQRVLLYDGSVLQLNTDSQARVRLSKTERQVHLLRGEAYFDVAHDAGRPFDVIAGGTVVRAVGTAFAVRLRDPARVEVVVSAGRIALRQEGESMPNAAADDQTGDSRLPRSAGTIEKSHVATRELAAGETAEAGPTGLVVTRLQDNELERRLAWQTGQLVFRGEPLANVVAEFNRYNHRRLEIIDPALASVEVGGNFNATDLESFIAAMRGISNVRVEEAESVVRLYAP